MISRAGSVDVAVNGRWVEARVGTEAAAVRAWDVAVREGEDREEKAGADRTVVAGVMAIDKVKTKRKGAIICQVETEKDQWAKAQ